MPSFIVQPIQLFFDKGPADEEGKKRLGESLTIRRGLFPLAYDDPSSAGDLALVRYCPQCRTAKAEFLDDEDAPSDQLEWREATEAYIARKHPGFAASRTDVQ